MLRSELRAAGAEQEPPEVRAAVGAEAGGARPRWGTEMPAMTAGGGGGGAFQPQGVRQKAPSSHRKVPSLIPELNRTRLEASPALCCRRPRASSPGQADVGPRAGRQASAGGLSVTPGVQRGPSQRGAPGSGQRATEAACKRQRGSRGGRGRFAGAKAGGSQAGRNRGRGLSPDGAGRARRDGRRSPQRTLMDSLPQHRAGRRRDGQRRERSGEGTGRVET